MQLKDLHPNDKNPRSVTQEKLDMLKNSLNTFGDLSGIVFNKKSKRLVGGHQRKVSLSPDSKIVIEKKYSKPTKTGTVAEGYVIANGERFSYREVVWDSSNEKAANIAANKGAGEWDSGLLSEWMRELDEEGFDLDLTMFDEKERQLFLEEPEKKGLCDEDEVPTKVPAKSKLGDLFIMGNHRLLCGDSTDILQVEKLMGGEKADMVFTDPPYNYTPTNRGAGALGAQASKVGKKIEFISEFDPKEFLSTLVSLNMETFASYIFCNTELVVEYLQWAIDNKFNYNILCWHKTKFIPANSNHHYPDTEYCLFISKKPIFNSGLSPDHYRKYWIQNKDGNDLHPTMKPVEIIQRCVELNSKKSVLDLFGGSGSTLIACEKTKRKCFMMELDPHYCDVIVSRWEKYTGKKATLQSSRKTVNGKPKR